MCEYDHTAASNPFSNRNKTSDFDANINESFARKSLTVIGRNVPVEVVRERLSSGAPEYVQVPVVRHHGVTVALLWRRGRPAQDVFRRDPPPTTSTKITDYFLIQILYFQLEFTHQLTH